MKYILHEICFPFQCYDALNIRVLQLCYQIV